MQLNYSLTNAQDDDVVTLVFPQVDATEEEFSYVAWNLLNPSPRATQSFILTDALYFRVSAAGAAPSDPKRSHLIRAFRGDVFEVIQQPWNIEVKLLRSGGGDRVAIHNPRMAQYQDVDIEWYLGGASSPLEDLENGSEFGFTAGLEPGSSVSLSLRRGLHFLCLPQREGVKPAYSLAEVRERAILYVPPITRRHAVGVRLAQVFKPGDEALLTELGYEFEPPSAPVGEREPVPAEVSATPAGHD